MNSEYQTPPPSRPLMDALWKLPDMSDGIRKITKQVKQVTSVT